MEEAGNISPAAPTPGDAECTQRTQRKHQPAQQALRALQQQGRKSKYQPEQHDAHAH